MSDQATFKWGGRFQSMDRVTRKPVSGRVFGSFTGVFPAEQQQTLAAQFLMAFQNMLAGVRTPLAEATTDLAALSAEMTGVVAAELDQAGASGSISIAAVNLD